MQIRYFSDLYRAAFQCELETQKHFRKIPLDITVYILRFPNTLKNQVLRGTVLPESHTLTLGEREIHNELIQRRLSTLTFHGIIIHKQGKRERRSQ